jgi:hypothetical protein
VDLSEAVRRKHATVNVAITAKAPRVEEDEIEPLTVDEAKGCSWPHLIAATARGGLSRLPFRTPTGRDTGAAMAPCGPQRGHPMGSARLCSDRPGCTAAATPTNAARGTTRRNRVRRNVGGTSGPVRHPVPLTAPVMPAGAHAGRVAVWCSMTSSLVLAVASSALPERAVTLLTEHQRAQQREREMAGNRWADQTTETAETGRSWSGSSAGSRDDDRGSPSSPVWYRPREDNNGGQTHGHFKITYRVAVVASLPPEPRLLLGFPGFGGVTLGQRLAADSQPT